MQHKTNENLQLTETVAFIIKQLRRERSGLSASKFADSYGIEKSTLLRIERAEVQSKLVTIWEISNALGMKCSQVVALIEEQLGEGFTLIDE